MAYSKKTELVEEAASRLISQFKDRENLQALLVAYTEQNQELENALSDILTKTTVASSQDAQLDQLGSIIGEERLGRDDLSYGTAVRAKLVLNISKATIEDVITLVRSIVQDPGIRIEIVEFPQATLIVRIVDPIDPAFVDVSQLATFVSSGRPASVRGTITYGVAGSFRFDTGPGFDVGKWATAESA